MNCLAWIFLFWVFHFKIFKTDSTTPSINLIARYSSKHLVLICDVKSEDVFSSNIYLNCPFYVTQICYSNCKPSCQSPNDCLPMISSCSIEKLKEDNVKLKWNIDVTFINKSGEWKCSHRNINSNSISLEKYSNKANMTYLSKEAHNIRTTTIKEVIYFPLLTRFKNSKIANNPYDSASNYFWQFITRPDIVLMLVCVFTVSLILNIIFVIRCALFRSVIDNYLKEKKSPNSCIFRFFCIPVNQNLPIVNMKSLTQTNPPAYISYHREEVYDDMSSGSQADRHLINNYSHYELEHDSMMSRKLWNSEGSHNITNRQSHVCPSQGVGNYVIVTGPVCTNRNHMVLNSPSNTSLISNSQHTNTTDAVGRSPSNEFQRQDYSIGSDNIIYSQPIKNRTKSFDDASYNNPNICMSVCPPAPPDRHSIEQVQVLSLNSEHIPMKNVDLIEHYTNTLTIETPEENIN